MTGAPAQKKDGTASIDEATLREIRFFRGFPDILLLQVATAAKRIAFARDEKILEQGQDNHDLFFLLSGTVGILVDEGRVAELKRKGDILGEMSVITGDPCTATIVAETDVEVLIVSSKAIEDMPGADEDKFLHALYRIYAVNLLDKLKVTNEKAKHFEQFNDRLEEANQKPENKVKERTRRLEQQYDELATSHKRIEELYRTRDVTFEKLEELYKGHLVPLRFTLAGLEGQVPGKAKEAFVVASKEVDDVMTLLEPISRLYKSEKAMQSKQVLLVDGNKKQLRVAKMALGGTGVELRTSDSVEAAREELKKKKFDIVLLDSQTLDLASDVRKHSPSADIVVLTSEPIPDYLPRLLNQKQAINLVSRDANDRLYTVKNIMTSVTKLAGDDIFGMEKYLGWGVDVQSVDVVGSNQRQDLIDGMLGHFKNLSVRRSILDRCHTVVEELLMNAIYDAPTNEVGKAIYNHLDRKEVIQLGPEHQARLKYATDGLFVAVSVEDPNGALGTDTVLKYLDSCYGGRAGELNKDKGGAGRGLHQIIENSDLVVFNISGGVKTEVIAFFSTEPKDSADKFPSFHIFVQ